MSAASEKMRVEAILDRELSFEDVRYERVRERIAARGEVHISFKLAVDLDGERRYGSVLVADSS